MLKSGGNGLALGVWTFLSAPVYQTFPRNILSIGTGFGTAREAQTLPLFWLRLRKTLNIGVGLAPLEEHSCSSGGAKPMPMFKTP